MEIRSSQVICHLSLVICHFSFAKSVSAFSATPRWIGSVAVGMCLGSGLSSPGGLFGYRFRTFNQLSHVQMSAVLPESFQVVVCRVVLGKHMHHKVQVLHQYSLRFTVHLSLTCTNHVVLSLTLSL